MYTNPAIDVHPTSFPCVSHPFPWLPSLSSPSLCLPDLFPDRCPSLSSRASFLAGVNTPRMGGGDRGSVPRASASWVFRNLDADDFRDPLDKQNKLILRAIPGLNDLGKALLGSITEQVMLLENFGTLVLVSTKQLPDLHQLMVEAAQILNLEAPYLYVRQSPVPNAYTFTISGKMPSVVVHTSLVELLNPKRTAGLGGLIAQSLKEQLFRWLRAAELTCDRATLLVAQDPKVVVSVLMKLAGGCPPLADQLNAEAFLEQARSYDRASSNPASWYIRNAQTRQLSHPIPVLRAREIDEWSTSQEYKALLHSAAQTNSLETV